MPNKSSNKAKSQRSRERALLQKVHLNAAGIDIGADAHWVAVPEDRDGYPVRSFGVFTRDQIALCDWLKRCQVETIVMESTGVYWIPLYQMLERKGFEVRLVNAHHVKNLPGRKTDVKDCQWLQQLHTYGLLTASFRPQGEIIVLRRYLRHRETLVQEAATCIQRIQKALTEMNLQLANVISDISGTTGSRILHAIVEGERDPQRLAAMRDWRIKATPEEVANSLLGNWRDELIFIVEENLALYGVYQEKIERCDQRIEHHLKSMPAQIEGDNNPLAKPRK